MSMIIVTPLSEVEETVRRDRPSHLMTLLSPEHMIQTPTGIELGRHLKVGVNDVVDVAYSDVPPGAHHVREILEFGRGWDAKAPMLVHCWAGISRSMAAAYILLCDRHEPGLEKDIARGLRNRAPHAYPNSLLIRLADEALGRNGRMVEAINGIGRGRIVAEGERVELPVALEEL